MVLEIHDLRLLTEDIKLDYLVISKTKFDDCFHNAKFNLRGFEIAPIRDRDKYERGIIVGKDPSFLKD